MDVLACAYWTRHDRGLDPDLSYYAGKAAVERLVEGSGLPHANLRPACFFGPGSILIENVAWAARRVPAPPPIGDCVGHAHHAGHARWFHPVWHASGLARLLLGCAVERLFPASEEHRVR